MEPITLVKAMKAYFSLDGPQMILEFKQLTNQDKDDFVTMFAEIGMVVTRG